MTGLLMAPAPPPVENTWAAPGIATAIAVALAIAVFALVIAARGRIRNPNDFLLAGNRIGVRQNTLAMVGSGIMYSTVIIISGHVALNGFDAILLLTAFTISTVAGVLLYAGPVRNVGGHTMGDLFALRARERPARIASAVITLVIYAMFTVIALASVGMVTSRMFDTSPTVNVPIVAAVIALTGIFAIAWVYMGGMLGVTRLLVLKVSLMIVMIAVLTVAVLAKYKMNLFSLLDAAEANAVPNPRGDLLTTGRLFGEGATYNSGQDPWVHLSKAFSIAAGAVAMPFLFMRFFVAANGREARRATGHASMITVALWSCLIFLGLGAIAILGPKGIGVVGAHRDITLPKLVDNLGGEWAAGALGAIALLSVGAIFAVLLLNAVTSVTKDINASRSKWLEPTAELKEIRRNVLIIGAVSVVLGTAMMTQLTHIFIPTSIDLAGSTILPAVIYSLFWSRYNTRGLMWTVYGGLAVTLFMVVFSNGVSGDPTAIFPNADFKFVDFEPGLIGVPLGFLFGLIGSLTSSERNDAAFAEVQVRALTGAVIPARTQPPADRGVKVEPERNSPVLSEVH